jgi:hypothetical protein
MTDEDPAAPAVGEIASGLTLEQAVRLTNGVRAAPSPAGAAEIVGFAAAAGLLPIDIDQTIAFVTACMTSTPRVHYGLGVKIPSDASQPGDPSPPGFVAVDCSGFVRAAIRRSTHPQLTAFPDGSVVQHDWVDAHGFAAGAPDDGTLRDGRVRIAFLPPTASPDNIGHVVLIYNGETLESHGGVGPDRRVWTTLPWRTRTAVYRLT